MYKKRFILNIGIFFLLSVCGMSASAEQKNEIQFFQADGKRQHDFIKKVIEYFTTHESMSAIGMHMHRECVEDVKLLNEFERQVVLLTGNMDFSHECSTLYLEVYRNLSRKQALQDEVEFELLMQDRVEGVSLLLEVLVSLYAHEENQLLVKWVQNEFKKECNQDLFAVLEKGPEMLRCTFMELLKQRLGNRHEVLGLSQDFLDILSKFVISFLDEKLAYHISILEDDVDVFSRYFDNVEFMKNKGIYVRDALRSIAQEVTNLKSFDLVFLQLKVIRTKLLSVIIEKLEILSQYEKNEDIVQN